MEGGERQVFTRERTWGERAERESRQLCMCIAMHSSRGGDCQPVCGRCMDAFQGRNKISPFGFSTSTELVAPIACVDCDGAGRTTFAVFGLQLHKVRVLRRMHVLFLMVSCEHTNMHANGHLCPCRGDEVGMHTCALLQQQASTGACCMRPACMLHVP
eukprot:355097-Chlamydomonas_euryale.AAC.3